MATTTNYSWSTPDDTALVKDGAAAIRSLGTAIDSTVFTNAGAAINKTIIDAKGDLIVGTAADTAARLAVGGTNGHVLTVDSGEASGIKWAAAAAGAGNMTQIATGTLSGASVVFSSLSTYTDILLFVYGTTHNTADSSLFMQLNATATNHNGRGWRLTNNVNGYYGSMASDYLNLTIGGSTRRTDGTNNYLIKLTNCKNAGFTDVDWSATYRNTNLDYTLGVAKGLYDRSEAISSITLLASGGTWAGGDYYVWGA
jgi:hypothetical protein